MEAATHALGACAHKEGVADPVWPQAAGGRMP
jgi:hypothetical protein